MHLRVSLAAFSSVTLLAALASAQPAASAGTLLTCDFSAGAVWPVSSDSPAKPGVAYGKFGTPDTRGSAGIAAALAIGAQQG